MAKVIIKAQIRLNGESLRLDDFSILSASICVNLRLHVRLY